MTQPFTGNSLGLPDSVAIAACGTVAGCSPAADWVFTQPFNSDGGDLDGFEISYQQAFANGIGLMLELHARRYRRSTTSIRRRRAVSATRDLLGMSPDAYNATLYYETERFSVRGSASYRDAFLDDGARAQQ